MFSPVDGTYEIVPYVLKANGTITTDISGFQVGGTLSGSIGGTGHTHEATKVEFTVRHNGAQNGDQLFFKTYVTDADGVRHSLDSETQLYDMRGYHYFRIDDPLQ